MSNNPVERAEGANVFVQHGRDASDELRSVWLGTGIEQFKKPAAGLDRDGVLELSNPFEKPSDPFKQSGFDESTGTWDKVWHGVKKFFGQEDKLDDQIKKYVEDKKLNADEKKELEKEHKLYEEELHKREMSEVQMNLNGKLYPLPDIEHDPRFKEMKHLNDLVKAEEKSIQQSVESKMGQLMPQVKKDIDDYDGSYEIHNPIGTGEGFRPHHAGPYLQVYWDQVRQETEKRAHDQT